MRVLLVPLVLMLLLPPPNVAASQQPGEVQLSGGPGDWAFVVFEFPEPAARAEYRYTFEFAVDTPPGTPSSRWSLFPAAVLDFGQGPELRPHSRAAAAHEPHGGRHVQARTGGGSIEVYGGGVVVGYAVGVAADAAWTLRAAMSLPDGTPLAPGPVSSGEAASFTLSPDIPLPLSGEASVEASFDRPGWTHFEADATHLSPHGDREYDIRFPSGTHISGSGSVRGVGLLVVGGAASTDYVGSVGEMFGAAGDFRATVRYQEASLGVRGLVVHLPIDPADLPAAPPVPYSGSEDVFDLDGKALTLVYGFTR